ncbi:MAG: hypothetical protein HC915_01835 [Anaerolineae bacterium]|nr:hypothetical protein [Anaerolineae bacterium]
MNNRFVVKMLVLALIVVLTAPMFGTASAQDGTIVDVASNTEGFSTLVAAVQAAGLVETLSGEGPFTVFAPTDEAFAALGEDVIAAALADPDLLTAILTYHVVSGAVMSTDLSDGMEVETVNGELLFVQVDDMGVQVGDANVVQADIEASNGVIHVIDTVLIPLPPVDPAMLSGDLIIAGSSTVGPLTEAMLGLFDDLGFAGNFSNDQIGSGGGFERLCVAGDIDISNASRPIREEEVANCAALPTPRVPLEFRVGTDALAVVVSTANDFITDVTLEELALIFSTAETWADVNPDWPAEPILRYIPGTDSGTFDYFVEEVFDENAEPILAASNTQLSEDDNVLVQGVEGSPFAIAFFGYAYYAEEADRLKILNIEGVEPSFESVEAAEYPLARPLFIYSDAAVINEKPQVAGFINFYLSNVQDVIEEVGYFPASSGAIARAKALLAASLSMGMME